jgi:hypothetical protein
MSTDPWTHDRARNRHMHALGYVITCSPRTKGMLYQAWLPLGAGPIPSACGYDLDRVKAQVAGTDKPQRQERLV